jgi:hypothetical protein
MYKALVFIQKFHCYLDQPVHVLLLLVVPTSHARCSWLLRPFPKVYDEEDENDCINEAALVFENNKIFWEFNVILQRNMFSHVHQKASR